MIYGQNSFDVTESQRRCLNFRRRILDISQVAGPIHIAPAFSCLEAVEVIYYGLMRRNADGGFIDFFVMSKGHGSMAQYVILEDLGIIEDDDLARYNKADGRMGTHPTKSIPGVEASTGSLGHGLGMVTGMAYADRLQGVDSNYYCLLGDGEVQEGSIWEAIMMAPNLNLDNLVAVLDFNDFQGLGRTTQTHPHLLPMTDKVKSFGWEAVEVNGHDAQAIYNAVQERKGGRPFFIVCRTVKGKGVPLMENQAIWHYRSPNKEEYEEAIAGLKEVSS